MNDNGHRMIPAGTITDQDSGNTASVFRDYDTGMILGARLNEANLIILRDAIGGILDGIGAYRRELAAEAADDLDEEDHGNGDLSGSAFPGRPGYLTGTCGHAVARSEWRAGFRTCEHCAPGTNIYVTAGDDSGLG